MQAAAATTLIDADDIRTMSEMNTTISKNRAAYYTFKQVVVALWKFFASRLGCLATGEPGLPDTDMMLCLEHLTQCLDREGFTCAEDFDSVDAVRKYVSDTISVAMDITIDPSRTDVLDEMISRVLQPFGQEHFSALACGVLLSKIPNCVVGNVLCSKVTRFAWSLIGCTSAPWVRCPLWSVQHKH